MHIFKTESNINKVQEASSTYKVGQKFKNKLGTIISIFDVDSKSIGFHMISKNGIENSWNTKIESFSNMLAFNDYIQI